ncbi:MAG: hypothetical protein JNK60_17360, partial [Acidobacteria bacterium]|nr:hypothetical protein [Acidobacteriota bacterium]
MRVIRENRLLATVLVVVSTVAGAAGAQTITEFPVSAGPYGITRAQDGSLFFTEFGGEKVSRMTTAGVVTNRFPIPLTNPLPFDITTDSAGNIWFTDALKEVILKMTPTGTFTFPSPYSVSGGGYGIVAGPDGKMWFTQFTGNRIGRLDTVSGNATFIDLPTPGSTPTGIVVGPDGNIWITEKGSNKIGRITMAGVLTEFTVPTAGSG